MKIETKYDVGDKVWVVERSYGDIKYYAKSATIWMLQIKLYDDNWLKNSAVYYSFKDIFSKKKCGYCAWKPYIILDAL